jgi:NAD(P)-dependent dehydrogenase (short-subunit alcohol dehydrogenase family)
MEEMQMEGIALVTGSSTGIGFETCLALARNRFHTYATIRHLQKGGAIERVVNKESLPLSVIEMDVNDEDSVRRAVIKIIDEKKRIDILVNNAGYGLFGALEGISLNEIRDQFETNYFGAIRVMKQVIPTMRRQRSGIIINVSSIAGVVGIPGECIYSSSKFALEGLSESISYELQPYGIKLVLIEPGVINTNFVPNIRFPGKDQYRSIQTEGKKNNDSLSYFSETVDAFLSHYYSAMRNAPPSTLVSDTVIEAINNASKSSQALFRYLVGEDSKCLAACKKFMSDAQLHAYVEERLLR